MFTPNSCYAQLMGLTSTAGPHTFAGFHIAMLIAIVLFYPAIYFIAESAVKHDIRNRNS